LKVSKRARQIVIYHGANRARRSLLILDPALPAGTPARVLSSDAIGELVVNAKERLGEIAAARLPEASQSSDAIDAIWVARPRVIVAPEPKLEFTCVCRPAPRVECDGHVSTAGACVVDKSGSTGLTVCYHGTGPAKTSIKLDGVAYTVTTDSEVLDTCFVAVPKQQLPPSTSFSGKGGVLVKRAPGAQERHTFWAGTTGGVKGARIVGVDYGVPVLTPGRQLCVYTDAVTNYGDSGGALVNDNDQLVGFSFQRTPFGSEPEFATWVWAAAAFNELTLKPYTP
jgi:hypothetical protein